MTLIVIVTAGLLLPLSLLLLLFLHRRSLPNPLYEPSGLSIGAIFDSSLPNPQDEPSVLSIIRSISNVSFLDPQDDLQDDPQDDPQDEPSGGLSSTLVQKLPKFKTSKPARPDGSECVVCLDGFRKGRWCRRLPGCGHVFHRKCVDTWFLRADTCPTCRARVRLTEEDAQQG